MIDLSTPTQDKFGGTAMHEAAREGHTDVVTMLTGRMASVNIADDDGNMPLHIAARTGQTEVVEQLLEKGVDDSKRNKDDLTYSDLVSILYLSISVFLAFGYRLKTEEL